jgi:tetratricopeptide (TPR) repeat protein
MERMLSEADRLQDRLLLKNRNLTEAEQQQLVDAYSAIAAKATPPPNSSEAQSASDDKKQTWAIGSLALTRIGILYLNNEKSEKAYESFKAVFDNPATTAVQKNAVTSYMANIMEKMSRYSDAAMLYDTLATGYIPIIVPQNPNMDALEAPIKAANMWDKAGNPEKSNSSMESARKYYSLLAEKYKGTLMEPAAIGKIAATYIQQQRYTEAIDIMKSVKDDSSGQISPGVLLMIGDLYMKYLKDYTSAERIYRDFVQLYPDNQDLGTAKLGVGLSLFEQTKYREARKAVEDIEKMPKAKPQVIVQSIYLIAMCFDHEDKWELAKGQLEYIQSSFAGTNESFDAGLYLVNHYRTRGLPDIKQKEFNDQVEYINKFINMNNSDISSVSRAMGYLVRAYSENNQMDKATEQLILLHDRYPQLPEGKFAPLRLSDIYENVLFDSAKAVNWLKIFLNDNPDAGDRDKVKAHIEELEAKKAR